MLLIRFALMNMYSELRRLLPHKAEMSKNWRMLAIAYKYKPTRNESNSTIGKQYCFALIVTSLKKEEECSTIRSTADIELFRGFLIRVLWPYTKENLAYIIKQNTYRINTIRVQEAASNSLPSPFQMTLVQPTAEQSVIIRQELREPENGDEITRDIAAIREWLEKQPHLPKDMDDGRLRTFLRGCKFSLEKVKKKLDMYYTMRNAVPEFFNDRDIDRPELKEIMDNCHVPPLPNLTPNGRRVTILRAMDKDIPTPNASESMKLVMMIGDIRLVEESVGVAGDVFIFDAVAASPKHLPKFTPQILKKFFICVQEAYPAKIKEIHIINVSPLVDSLVNFVKPFLKEKIRNRIYMHSNIDDLYKFVPKNILPTEYGGDAGTIVEINEAWREKIRTYTPWFKEQEKSKANEALRPGAPKTADDLFGMDGTFRKLTID